MLKLLFLFLAIFTTKITFASDDFDLAWERIHNPYEDNKNSNEKAQDYEANGKQFEKSGEFAKAARCYEDAAYYFKRICMFKRMHRAWAKAGRCWLKAEVNKKTNSGEEEKEGFLERAEKCSEYAAFYYDKTVNPFEVKRNYHKASNGWIEGAKSCLEASNIAQAKKYFENAAINYFREADDFAKVGIFFRAVNLYNQAIMAWENAGKSKKAQECRGVVIQYCKNKALELETEKDYAEAGDCLQHAARFCKGQDAQKHWESALAYYKLGAEYLSKKESLFGVANCLRGEALCLGELDNNELAQGLWLEAANRYEEEAFELLKKKCFFSATECYGMAAFCWEELGKPEIERVWTALHESFYKKLRMAHNHEQKYVIARILSGLFSWGSADNKMADKKTYWLEAASAYEEVAKLKSSTTDKEAKGCREKAKILRNLCND